MHTFERITVAKNKMIVKYIWMSSTGSGRNYFQSYLLWAVANGSTPTIRRTVRDLIRIVRWSRRSAAASHTNCKKETPASPMRVDEYGYGRVCALQHAKPGKYAKPTGWDWNSGSEKEPIP